MRNIYQQEGSEIIFYQQSNYLSFFSSVVSMTTITIGTGIVKMGYLFQSGVILTPILIIIIGIISVFNLYLFTKLGCKFHGGSFEQLWIHIFGKKTLIINILITICSSITCTSFYISTLISSLKFLILLIYPGASQYITDFWTLGLIVSVFISSPFYLSKNLTIFKNIAFIKSFFIISLLICMIIELIIVHNDPGFKSSSHSIIFFKFDSKVVKTIGSLFTIFLNFPLAYPSINHFKNATEKSIRKIFFFSNLYCFFIYIIFGLVSYFSFYENNKAGTIFDLFKPFSMKTISCIIICLIYIFTVHGTVNPLRFVILTSPFGTKDVPYPLWAAFGFLITFISMVLGSSTSSIQNVISVICDVSSALQLCIIPSILYLKSFGFSSKIHFILCIIDLIIGILGVLLLVYFVNI